MKYTLKIKYTLAFIELTGVVSFGIGIAGLMGHFYGIQRLYDWMADNSGQSFGSGLVDLFIGLAFLLIAKMLKRHEKNSGKV